MGMLLAIGGALALYQMTSLVLGPGANRQLSISLNIPAVDVEDLSTPSLPNVNLVLGRLAAPPVPIASPMASHAVLTRPAVGPTGATSPAPRPIAPIAVSTPAPSPENPTVHPSPRPTLPTQPVPVRTDD